ncbi:MAG: M13 family metallopeptidase [Clostridiales bacterium]|nr:M13 family metallopeptidase [Clostridiales bacterium]
MRLKKAAAAILCAAVVLSGCSGNTTDSTEETEKKSDFSRSDIEDIRAQDDYYGYVNLDTLKSLNIEPGMKGAGAFYDTSTADAIAEKLKEVVTSNEKYPEGSCEDILRKVYYSYVAYEEDDEVKKNCAAILETDIDRIMNAKNIDEFMTVTNDLQRRYSIETFGKAGVTSDLFDPDKYCIIWAQSATILGQSLEDISKDTTKASDGETIIIDCLMTAGVEHEDAENTAHDLMYKVIDIAWATDKEVLDAIDPNAYIKFMTEEEIDKELTNHKVRDYEKWYGISENPYGGWQVNDISQIAAIDKILTNDNLDILKAWIVTSLVSTYGEFIAQDHPEIAKYFPKSADDIDEQAYRFININYGLVLSDFYLKYFYTDEMETQLRELCDDLISGYRVLIGNADWLSEESREGLIRKLDNIEFITGKTLLENMKDDPELSRAFDNNLLEAMIEVNCQNYEKNIKNIGTVRDRNEQGMSMQTVNACYSWDNRVTITSAIMTDPWFGTDKSYYENLGGLGTVVAHELGHAFDSNGIKFNENGVFDPSWLNEEDVKKLEERNSEAIDYFENTFNVFTIYSVDGEKTLGENYADLSGMEAVMTVCDMKGCTKEDYETVFESFGSLWALLQSDTAIISQLAGDVHSPSEIRVNAILATTDKFYEVYDVKEGDKMYVAPEDRIGRWT